MEFFDKKQDVMDIRLTQFGRHLLSRGLFKPIYYSFHDDNILYNTDSANFSELQNDSEHRIKEAQTVQPQISFSSLEKEFENSYQKILSGQEKAGSQALQPSAIRNYSFSAPIGTSNINSDYAPAWQVDFLKGKITGSVGHVELSEKSGGKNILKIPQIHSQILVEYTSADDIQIETGTELASNIGILTDEEDMILLLRIGEENSPFQKENFDIEIFEIQEEEENNNVIEILRPLSFTLEQETSEYSFIDQVLPESDVSHVQHYFDLLTDEEIDDEILCKYDPVQTKRGVFADKRTKICQDVLNEEEKQVFDIYEDGADDPGDVC
jgi:hypothetical protein